MSDIRLDIMDVLHRYCLYVDTHRIEAAVDLFEADGILDLGFARIDGHEAIRSYFTDRKEQAVVGRHVLTNVVMTFSGSGEVDVSSSLLLFRSQFGCHPALVGNYEDRLVSRGSGWRFASRRLAVFAAEQLST